MKASNGRALRQCCSAFRVLAVLDLIAGLGLFLMFAGRNGALAIELLIWSMASFLSLVFAAYVGSVLADIHEYFVWAKAEHDKRAVPAAKPVTPAPPPTKAAPVPTRAKVISGDMPEGWEK